MDGLPENLTLHPDFGDVDAMFNSRDWLERALTEAGAAICGKGVGMGGADLDVFIEGFRFNIRITSLIDAP